MNQDVETCNPSLDADWDDFVVSHPFGWVCHMSAWKEVLEDSFGHLTSCHLCLRDKRTFKIVAALPLYRVNSWITGNRLVCIPFATLCDPLVSSPGEFFLLFDNAKKMLIGTKSKYLEIRFAHAEGLAKRLDIQTQKHYKHHFIPLDKSPSELFEKFHRTTIRQRIRKAEKMGLEIHEAKEETDIADFYRLHLDSRKRLMLPPHPYRFIVNIWRRLEPLGMITLLFAKKERENIAAIMCFRFKGRMSVEYSVVKKEYMHLQPNHLLFWTAIKKASNEGFSIFDFGRTPGENVNLIDFKRRWGTTEIDLPQIFFPNSNICDTVDHRRVARKVVMQACRMAPQKFFFHIGNFCYRHLG
jgi:CelD/BcsL family acetyltransferase involved in cellulose biosynthesis